MKNLVILFLLSILVLSCKNGAKDAVATVNETVNMEGEWDNFQQYWLENTAEAIHRTDTDDKHKHLSLHISAAVDESYSVEIREGRNGENLLEKMMLNQSDLASDFFKKDGDTLYVSGKSPFKNKDAYKFVKARKFSGWLEAPVPQYKDSIYRNSNLEISDQGGMAEINIEGVQYTAELTQLLFAHKLAIMKLAIYDMPMDSVGINSRSISYTWLNPEAKRTGINLRKITAAWTFIEPGYINSDNTKFGKK